ncbi:hypothetical protein EUX98_g7303 [Antrodiella citrinella]|uniref:Uncharacterized protein n=1 Tax=Antrodiella citrinella TaxID=2447956 RepID=A0A4S4MLW0_9APHY|nr:hypothetical protein EUX98_g7303 [Antrodiella citrinella]
MDLIRLLPKSLDPTAFIICCDKPVCQPVGYTSEECFAALGLLTLASSQPAAATISPVPGPYEAQESSSVVRYATVEDDPFFTALEELCDPDGSSKTSLEPLSPLAHLTPLLDTSISLSSLAGDQEDDFWEGDSFDTFVQDGPLTLSDSEDGFSTSNDWKLVVEEKEYAPRCHGQDEDVEMGIEDGVFQAWESGREWEGNHSPTYNEDDDDQRCTGAAQYDFLLDCDMDASGMGFDHVMKEVMDPGSDWAQTLFTF